MEDHAAWSRSKNPEMNDRWAEYLLALGYSHGGPSGCGTWTSDGIYFYFIDATVKLTKNLKPQDIQLVFVGGIQCSPSVYARALGPKYWVKSVSVIEPALMDAEPAQLIIERGFFSVILRCIEDEERPTPAAEAA